SRMRAVTMAAVAGMRPLRHDPDAGVALTRLPDEPRPREWSGARTPTVVPIRRCRNSFLSPAPPGWDPFAGGPYATAWGGFRFTGPRSRSPPDPRGTVLVVQ